MIKSFPHKAMVLAAGLGLRMRAFDASVPKPLVRIAGKTLLDWSLDTLAESGIVEAVVNTHHMAEMVAAHLATRQKPHITISHETELLETGGGIKKALSLLGDAPFFVKNSDTICRNGLAKPFLARLSEAWDDAEMDALLLLMPKEKAIGFEGAGDFFLHEGGTLQRRGEAAQAPYVFTGVQLLHPRFFNHAPEGAFSMNVLYNKEIDSALRLRRVKGLVHDGMWLHVGDAQGVAAAEQALAPQQV